MTRIRLVAIGSSAGGLDVAKAVLASLEPAIKVPIVLVQHRAPDSSDQLLRGLAKVAGRGVREAYDGDPVTPGSIYVAPAGYHLFVDHEGIHLDTPDPRAASCPSIDLFFRSVARTYGEGALGLILSGMNSDGASGLLEIRRKGGRTMVQDPSTCKSPAMPRAAIEKGGAEMVLGPDAMISELNMMLRGEKRGGEA